MASSFQGPIEYPETVVSSSNARRLLLGCTFTITALSYASHLVQRARGGGSIALFDVGDEVSIGTWFETIQLLLAAVGVASLVRTGATEPHLAGRTRLLALCFLGFSIDESVSLHERFGSALRDVLSTTGYLYYVWVIPAVAFAVLVAVWEAPWLRSLPSRIRSRVLLAGALFVASAGGLELLAGPGDERFGTETLRSVTFTAFEEFGEMLALSLFLLALLDLQAGRRLVLRFEDRHATAAPTSTNRSSEGASD